MEIQRQNSTETLCPHCGGPANWHFIDEARANIEIHCPDCGNFQLPRASFEQAEFDIAEAEQRRS